MVTSMEAQRISTVFTRFSLALAVVAFGAFAAACKSAPVKISIAGLPADVPITDAIKWQEARILLKDAEKQYIRKDFYAALAIIDKSLAAHDSFNGHYMRGMVMSEIGRPEEAMKELLRAENIRPTDEQLLLTLAILYTASGDVKKAVERYSRLSEAHPKEPLYPYKAGTTYKLLRDYDQAMEWLKKAVVPGFKHLDQVYLQMGDISLELKKYDEADGYFAKAVEANPALKDARSGSGASKMAKMLDQANRSFKDGKLDEALNHVTEAEKASPESPTPYLLRGTMLLASGRAGDAIAPLKKAVELGPDNPEAYSMLGSAEQKRKNYTAALEALREGLKRAPDNVELHNKTGMVLKDREELRKAIDSFHRAIELQPNYVPARLNLAFAYLDDHRYVDARREFGVLAQIDPKNEELKKGLDLVSVLEILDRGDRHLTANRLDAAVGEYQKAVDLSPKNPAVYTSMARAEIIRKNYGAAEKNFKKALGLDENNLQALQGLARVYALAGKKKDENNIIDRLNKLSGSDVTVGLVLGRIKEDQGNLEQAEKHYLGLLKSHPDNDAVKRRLASVYMKRGLQESQKNLYKPALTFLEKAKKESPDLPGLEEAIKTTRENLDQGDLVNALKKAEDHYSYGRYAEALPIFEKVYDKLRRPLILVKIAECRFALGQEERALFMLKVSEASSGDIEVSEAIYTYLLKKGDVVRAEAGFREIVQRHEDAYFSHYKLGVIEISRGKWKEAVQALDHALIYRPDFFPARIARGVAMYKAGDRDRARGEFEEAGRLEEDSPLARYNVAMILYNDNLLDKAEAIFKEVAQKHGAFPDARYRLSFIYFTRGELEKAEEEIQACLKLEAAARFYYALSRIQEKRFETTKSPADREKLRQSYREIIVRFPNAEEAEESRRRLLTLAPDSRVFVPYPKEVAPTTTPVAWNSLLLYSTGRAVVGMDSRSKRMRYRLESNADVASFHVDRVVAVLLRSPAKGTPAKVKTYDPGSGADLDEFSIETEGTSILGNGEKIGIIGQGTLSIYSRSGKLLATHKGTPRSSYFAGGGFFYRAEFVKNDLIVYRLAESGDVEFQVIVPARGEAVLPTIVKHGERMFLLFRNGDLAVLNEKKIELVSLKMPGAVALTPDAKGEGVYVAGNGWIRRVSESGKAGKDIKLASGPISPGALLQVSENALIVSCQDGKVRLIDLDAGEKWAQPFDRPAQGAVFTLYH